MDGANVTVDYYAAVVSINMSLSINKGATSELQIPSVSSYTFTKQETYGYSLVGKEFVVSAGGFYTGVQDNSAPVAVAARLPLRFSPASTTVRRLTLTAFPW